MSIRDIRELANEDRRADADRWRQSRKSHDKRTRGDYRRDKWVGRNA